MSTEYIKCSVLKIIQQSCLLESDSISIMKNSSHTRNFSQFRSQIFVSSNSENSSSNNNSNNFQSSITFQQIQTSKNQFSAFKNKNKKRAAILSFLIKTQSKQIKTNSKQTLK